MELEAGASSGNTRYEIVDGHEMDSSAEIKNGQETQSSLEDHTVMTLDKDEQEAEDGLGSYATIILDKNVLDRDTKIEDDANVIVHNSEQRTEYRMEDGTTITQLKTGCKARANATVFEDGSCRVNSVVLEHNHALFPSKSCFFLSDMKMNNGLQNMLESSNVGGINLKASFHSVTEESRVYENVSYLEKDCRNFGQKSKKLQLGIGDAEAMHDFFVRMQAKNSNFFYVVDFDGKSHIKNVFWADARSRAAYEEFGDVVMFDATYLANKYRMPLSTFTGVNHHGQKNLFGCSLLSDDAMETFIWLFKAWLSCMSGCASKAIVTDQAGAIKKAVEIVFPATRHSWSLWHVLRMLPEKLGNYELYEPINKALLNVVYDSSTKKEFENGWANMIKEFKELDDNEWLSNLYEEKNYWVPVFLKDTFWAGILSTLRNDSMIAFFDGNINPKTTIKQFLEQYNSILKGRVEKENQADIQSFNSWIPCVTHFPIEKQFQQVYTIEKFKAFQQEVLAKLYCEVCLAGEIDSLLEFNVSEILAAGEENNQHHRILGYKVYFNKEEHEINCACCLFESRGILCRHIVSVLIKIQSDITVSSKYVLSRWRKDLRRNHSRVGASQEDWSGNPEGQRYYYLREKFDDAARMAVTSDDACKVLWNYIDDYQKKLKVDDTESGNNNKSTGECC